MSAGGKVLFFFVLRLGGLRVYRRADFLFLIKKKLIYYEIKIRIRFNFKNIIRMYFPNKIEVKNELIN